MEKEYPLGTPQEHVLMCEKHVLMPIDVTCEDCEGFICSKCAKEDHKDMTKPLFPQQPLSGLEVC